MEISGPSLRHLRLFETVARVQCVRKAADVKHLSQPAVTQAIAKLESQVKAVLFERRSSGTYLTRAGEVLADRVGRMFQQIEEALAAFGVVAGPGQSLSSIVDRITRPQLRTLAAMTDGGTLSGATRCGMSQASLRRAARELEGTLGRPILRRCVAGVVTTPAGCELARKVSLAMRELELGIDELRAGTGHRSGELRMGMSLAGTFLLAPVLNEFMRCGSEARTQVRTADGRELTKALRVGELDFVVVGMRSQSDIDEIEQEPLVPLSYVVVARQNHPLTRKSLVTIGDLEECEWIAPSYGAARRAAFDRLAARMSRAPETDIEASSLSTIQLLLGGSDRLALLSAFEYEKQQKTGGGLVALPFARLEPADPLVIMRRANWKPTALHLRLLDIIRAQAAAFAKRDIYTGQAA